MRDEEEKSKDIGEMSRGRGSSEWPSKIPPYASFILFFFLSFFSFIFIQALFYFYSQIRLQLLRK